MKSMTDRAAGGGELPRHHSHPGWQHFDLQQSQRVQPEKPTGPPWWTAAPRAPPPLLCLIVSRHKRACVCACTRKSLLHLGLFSLGILLLNARALREKLPSKVQRCIDMSIYYAAILMISIQIENIDCVISKVQLYFDISAARLHQHSHSRARLPSVHPRQVMAGSREKDQESAAWHCFGFQTAARIKHSEIACFVLVKNFCLKMYCILDTVAVM